MVYHFELILLLWKFFEVPWLLYDQKLSEDVLLVVFGECLARINDLKRMIEREYIEQVMIWQIISKILLKT